MSTAIAGDEWLTMPEARARLKITRFQFHEIMKRAPLTIQQFPGCRPRVLASDLDRLARESVRTSTEATK
jgi:hypothetical protein